MSFKRITAILISVFALGTFAMAQDNSSTTTTNNKDNAERHQKWGNGEGRGGRHGGPGGDMMRNLRGLNLTDAQKVQVKAVFDKYRPNENDGDREAMRSIMEKKQSGTALTPEEQTRMKDFRLKMKANHDQMQSEIMAILTPDQKAQLEKNREERKERFKERRNQGQDKPDAKPTDN
jgi:periplasmic protein CpxP/Spy